MSDRVVVGVDDSGGAAVALRWALQEGLARDVEVDVVHAWELPVVVTTAVGLTDDVAWRGPAEAGAREVLAATVDRAVAETGFPADRLRQRLVDGHPGEVLLQLSEEAALLVVGSRGRGGFASMLLGSVSSQLVQHAACPVAVIPAGWATSARSTATLPIVAGVDGSEGSRAALEWAAKEAQIRQSPVWAVMAWSFLDQPRLGDHDGFDPQFDERDARDGLHRVVEEVVGPEEAAQIDQVVVADLPARALIEQAEEASMVVVGARGLGGFKGLVLGSVAQQVLHYASCPVVVIRIGR